MRPSVAARRSSSSRAASAAAKARRPSRQGRPRHMARPHPSAGPPRRPGVGQTWRPCVASASKRARASTAGGRRGVPATLTAEEAAGRRPVQAGFQHLAQARKRRPGACRPAGGLPLPVLEEPVDGTTSPAWRRSSPSSAAPGPRDRSAPTPEYFEGAQHPEIQVCAAITGLASGRAPPAYRRIDAGHPGIERKHQWALPAQDLRSPGTSVRGPAIRAMEPDASGYVEQDGIKAYYEVFGEGEPTIVFLPPGRSSLASVEDPGALLGPHTGW